MRRLAAVAPLVLFLVTSCAPAQPATSQPGPANSAATADPAAPVLPTVEKRAATQVLRIAKTGLPLNAGPGVSALNNDMLAQVFDTVAIFGKNFEVRPGIAEKWELRAAENTWRLTIRSNLTFSNGDKLTAEDVAYTFNAILSQRWLQLANVSLVQQATAINDTTVDVLTRGIDASLPNSFPSIMVVPAKVHQSISAADFGLHPVGSGPYELVEFRAADRAIYRLRSNYTHPYRRPAITELQFLAIPDLGQQINGLRGGALDFIQGTFTLEQVQMLKSQNYPISIQSAGVATAFFMQPEIELWNTPLKDKRVRQAMNYAINRQAIADALYKGYGEPAGQLADKTAPYYDPNKKPYAYDVTKAKQLLAEAGYPNGFKLESGIIFSAFGLNPTLVTTIHSAFKDIGIDMPINQMEQAAYTTLMGGSGGPRGDMSIIQVTDALGSFAQLPNLFDCAKQGFVRRWCNKEFDDAFNASKNEQTPAKQAAKLRDALALIDADVPYVALVTVPCFSITSAKVRGFEWPTRYYYDFDKMFIVE